MSVAAPAMLDFVRIVLNFEVLPPRCSVITSTKKGIDSVYSSVIFLQLKFSIVNSC